MKDSNYYLIEKLGSRGLAFIIIPIISRLLGVEAFADYDLFVYSCTLLGIFTILGIDSGIVILLSEYKEDIKILSFYYVFSLCLSTLLSLVIGSSFTIVSYLNGPIFIINYPIWFLITFFLIFSGITYQTFNFLRWRERAKDAAIISLLGYVLGILIGITLLYYFQSLLSYLLGLVLGQFISAIYSLFIAKSLIFNFIILENSFDKIKELLFLSIPFAVNYIGNTAIQFTDRFVILLMFGKFELGIFALVMKLSMIPQVLFNTLISGFLPVMYNNYKTNSGITLIRRFFHIYLLSIPILFIITYIFSDKILLFFGGEKYTEGGGLLAISLVSILLVNSPQLNSMSYTIARKTKYITYVTFISVFVNLFLSLVLCQKYGLLGVIYGTMLGGVFRTCLHSYFSEKIYSFQYSKILIIGVCVITIIESTFVLLGYI